MNEIDRSRTKRIGERFLNFRGAILLFAASILVSIFFCAFIDYDVSYYQYVYPMTIIAFSLFVAWASYTKRERQGNVCHPVVLFFIGFVIIYFQNPLFHFFGCETNMELRFEKYAPYGCAIALLALSSFFFGYFLFAKKYSSPYRQRPMVELKHVTSQTLNRISRWLAYAGGICAIIHFIYYGEYYFHGVRILYTRVAGAETVSIGTVGYFSSRIGRYLFYAAALIQWLHVLSRSPRTWWEACMYFDKTVFFLFVAFTFPQGLLGGRANLIYALSILGGPFFIFVKPLRWKFFVLILLLMISVLTFIGKNRQNRLPEDRKTQVIAYADKEHFEMPESQDKMEATDDADMIRNGAPNDDNNQVDDIKKVPVIETVSPPKTAATPEAASSPKTSIPSKTADVRNETDLSQKGDSIVDNGKDTTTSSVSPAKESPTIENQPAKTEAQDDVDATPISPPKQTAQTGTMEHGNGLSSTKSNTQTCSSGEKTETNDKKLFRVKEKIDPSNLLPEEYHHKEKKWPKAWYLGRNVPAAMLAGSNNTINITICLKDRNVVAPNYCFGKYFFQECTLVFPGRALFERQKPYREKKLGNELSFHYFYPLVPFTHIATSSLCTVYYDFGLIGIAIVLASLGLAVRKIEEYTMRSKNIFFIVFYIMLVPALFFSNRDAIAATFGVAVKFVVFTSLCICLGMVYDRFFKKSRDKNMAES